MLFEQFVMVEMGMLLPINQIHHQLLTDPIELLDGIQIGGLKQDTL